MTAQPLMLTETREAPEVIRRQGRENAALARDLGAALRARRPAYAATIARGSSDHAATVLKYALETTLGLPVASLGPSVHTLYGARLNLAGALVVAISQSGASPDVVESLAMARAGGATTVALVNVEDSPLAQAAEFVLPLRCGPERAVAATKSFMASLTAPLSVLADLAGDGGLQAALARLPEVLAEALTLEPQALQRAQPYRYASHALVLARGLHFGIAQEAALKLKETSGLHAEAYSAAEFAHGPRRLLTEGYPVLGFTSEDAAGPATAQAYHDLAAGGADLLLFGAGEVPGLRRLGTPASGHALTDPVVSALAFYLFAAHLALGRGLNPDEPPLLRKVTETR